MLSNWLYSLHHRHYSMNKLNHHGTNYYRQLYLHYCKYMWCVSPLFPAYANL